MYSALGEEAGLRPIIEEFVHIMVKDAMIGFFFDAVDVPRLIERELQFTAKFLGANTRYTGRPMTKAHAAHPIMGGQFDRRRTILKECIDRHGVSTEIKAAWLQHVDSLRAQVTRDPKGQCIGPGMKDTPKKSANFNILT